MIFPKDTIPDVLAGRLTELEIKGACKLRVGRSYAVESKRGKVLTRIVVTEVELIAPEAWVVRFKLDRRHETRLLHKDSSRGYTNVAAQALNREPEAVPETYQRQISEEAREKLSDRPLWEALKELEMKGLTPRQRESIRRRVEAARRSLAA